MTIWIRKQFWNCIAFIPPFSGLFRHNCLLGFLKEKSFASWNFHGGKSIICLIVRLQQSLRNIFQEELFWIRIAPIGMDMWWKRKRNGSILLGIRAIIH